VRAAPPPRGRPCQATPLPGPRRRPARRPRRWGRLPAAVLVPVLVAALVPGALADTDDGGAMPPAPGPVGDDTAVATSEAEALADTIEGRTPAASDDTTGTGGDGNDGTVAVTSTPGSKLEVEVGDPVATGDAVADTGVRASVQPGQDRGPDEEPGDPSDQAVEYQQRDASQGCGAAGRCPAGPEVAGDLAGAAAGAATGRPPSQPSDLSHLSPEARARVLEQERQRERQELERLVTDPDLGLDVDLILAAFDRRWAAHAAAVMAGEPQQVRREEPDPSMTAMWYARLEILRPAWQAHEVQGQQQMTDDQAAQHLHVGARAARRYLTYLRLEQAIRPIWISDEVIDALGRPVLTGGDLAERPELEGLGNVRMAQRVLDDLRAGWHEAMRLAAGEAPQPTGSALSRALQRAEPLWREYEIMGVEGVRRRLSGTEVAEDLGIPPYLARLALDYLRVERRLAAGETLEAIGSPLSRALQQVGPHWRAHEVEGVEGEGVEGEGVRVRRQLSAPQLARELGMSPVMVRAALSFLRSHHQEDQPEGQSQMRMEEGTEALVTPPTDGSTPRLPDPGGFTPLTEQDRQLAGMGGFAPLTEQDTQLAGTGGFAPLTERDRQLTQPRGFTATPAREVSTGTLAAVKAVATGAGVGLTYLLRFMTLGMCSRGACPALLGPVVPGAAGAVPGHLQG
jgi:hypothetical protein